MEVSYKPKYVVLQDFTVVLHKHDLMNLNSQNVDEYETEALSILSRFSEAALQLAEDETPTIDFAVNIISQTFNFWFGDLADDIDYEPIALELLKLYIDSYPPEEVTEQQVDIAHDVQSEHNE